MSTNNPNHTGAFLMGVLVGGLGAAVAGLLLAPQSGEKTREQLRQKALDVRASAEAKADEVARQAERLQSQALTALEEGQKQLLKAIEETKAAVERAGSPPLPATPRETDIVSKPEAAPAEA